MHEYSVVQSLLDLCQEHAAANNAQRVTKVVVKIGVMSGVEPYLLKEAFEAFKKATVCEDAQFIMNIQKVKIRCDNCNNENELEKNEYLCPKCQSNMIDVIDGDEMFLMQLEIK